MGGGKGIEKVGTVVILREGGAEEIGEGPLRFFFENLAFIDVVAAGAVCVHFLKEDEIGGSNLPSSYIKTRCPTRDNGFSLPCIIICLLVMSL